MYHPTTRLLTILELLQSNSEMSGVDLAKRLEVDVRTVRRYITMLQDMAIPIESERGRHGCYRLRAGYKLPPMMFSMDEATALTFGLLMTRRLGMGIDPVSVEGALAKLERVLPVEVRDPVHAIEEVLQVEMKLPDKSPDQRVVTALSLAAQRRQQVTLQYQAHRGNPTERNVDPYGVLYRNGYWYMAGYCHLRQDMRSFRLDRVVDVGAVETESSGKSFIQPADFDLLDFVEKSIGQTPGSWTVEVLLQTSVEKARQIIPRSVGTPQPHENGAILRAYVQHLDWFAYFLAGLDCPLQVLDPPEARDAVEQLASKLSRMVI